MLSKAARGFIHTNKRWLHSSKIVWDEISPSDPTEKISSSGKVVIRTGNMPWQKRLLEKDQSISTYPLYISPAAFHVSLSKRFSLLLMVGGGVIAEFFYASPTFSTVYAFLVGIPCMIPFPITHYLTSPYVTRIFRLYDKESKNTTNYEKLIKNERLIIERLSFSGRSTYNIEASLKDIKIKPSRFGWSNWLVEPRHGNNNQLPTPLYVNDHVGGYRMDRIWGIIEAQSGMDNGR